MGSAGGAHAEYRKEVVEFGDERWPQRRQYGYGSHTRLAPLHRLLSPHLY